MFNIYLIALTRIMGFQDKVMIGALIFLALSALYYIWLWSRGFVEERRSGEKITQPWE